MTFQRSRNPLWRLYEVWVMFFGLGLLALICLGSVPLFLLLFFVLPRRWHRLVSRRIVRYGFRAYLGALHWFGQMHFDLKDLDGLDEEGPLILIANHPSLLDAVMLLSCSNKATCVLKASLLQNPLYGVGARMARYVSNEDPRRMIEDGSRELQHGALFILFPEGGRTREFPLSELSSACILLSKQSQAPIQTVILEFSTPYLGKHWGLFNPPVLPLRVKARLGKRFDPPRITAQALKELDTYFRSEIPVN